MKIMMAREVELKGEDLVPELSPLVWIFLEIEFRRDGE